MNDLGKNVGRWVMGLSFSMIGLGFGQTINTGSNGSDGALNPTSDVIINMADHPTGIYQYTSVNIPPGVIVKFIPNANNTPVIWLVQGNCSIQGLVSVDGDSGHGGSGGLGGPGGFNGGVGGSSPSNGLGPGGGPALPVSNAYAGNGSFGTAGGQSSLHLQEPSGAVYGNSFLVPLVGGSGGGGCPDGGGGGGGGAILIAAGGTISIASGGILSAVGGVPNTNQIRSGAGSGGAIRLVANTISGNGLINDGGGYNYSCGNSGGSGIVRFDTYNNQFGGSLSTSVFTQGFQPIILPVSGQGVQLAITTVGSVPVASSPTGQLTSPDVVISGQQSNPIPIVVTCTNAPLNSTITVTVTPVNGVPVTVQGVNNTGTTASSTATVSLNMPHGGGTIYAQTVTNVLSASNENKLLKDKSYVSTGLTTDGERIAKIEVKSVLRAKSQLVYVTTSGKRIPYPVE